MGGNQDGDVQKARDGEKRGSGDYDDTMASWIQKSCFQHDRSLKLARPPTYYLKDILKKYPYKTNKQATQTATKTKAQTQSTMGRRRKFSTTRTSQDARTQVFWRRRPPERETGNTPTPPSRPCGMSPGTDPTSTSAPFEHLYFGWFLLSPSLSSNVPSCRTQRADPNELPVRVVLSSELLSQSGNQARKRFLKLGSRHTPPCLTVGSFSWLADRSPR